MAIIIPCNVSVGYSLVSQTGRDCLLEPACLLEIDKEIVIQSYGYAAEQFGVNAALAQDFVNIGAVATNFLGQPCRRAALTAQFVAD